MSEEGKLTPRNSANLLGHFEAEKTLLESYNSGRMHHAWLITGPRGIGKATLAYRFARFLLKHGQSGGADEVDSLFGDALPTVEPDSLTIDPDDPVFRRISASAHADLMTIEREFDEKKNRFKGVIGVDRVRGVGAFLGKTSAEGGWRVVIIDAADEMNRNSANAVLKVLEEPPAQAVLLLLAHNPGRLLPTIRSRCRTLTLNTLDDDTLVKLMADHAPDSSPEEALGLSKLAEGSFGRTLSLYEEGGLDLYNELTRLLSTLPQLDVEALHKLGDKMSRAGADEAFRTLGDLLCWWLGRLISQGARGKTSGLGLNESDDALMLRISQNADVNKLMDVWSKAGSLFDQAISGNLDRKQAVLNSFLALEGALKR
ncbi:DNA polymerase III subunit delta [Candidatus Terasakiella magnetica]|uniref:DNA polymerase III subunit delta n=1 Tax=Candidatus Terasakiella magnetica TaxID=1867952 RepID=A0A1C3RD82_9PROT|nr:DNA polymerase III subunit delta' [Candidatus Terasakiella magnetica]SCA55184.1 DNA polymerase III subunit delta [Candidatus Terasakiella magnetica]